MPPKKNESINNTKIAEKGYDKIAHADYEKKSYSRGCSKNELFMG
jgi:hypothetical protein